MNKADLKKEIGPKSSSQQKVVVNDGEIVQVINRNRDQCHADNGQTLSSRYEALNKKLKFPSFSLKQGKKVSSKHPLYPEFTSDGRHASIHLRR